MVDALRFLHVLSISLWIGAALWVPGDVRRTLALGRPHADALAARVRPMLTLDAAAGIAALLSGVLLLLAEGNARPRPGILLGLVLAVARLGVLTGLRRSVFGIAARAGGAGAPGSDDPSVRRLAMLAGIAHSLWLVALAGMVFPV